MRLPGVTQLTSPVPSQLSIWVEPSLCIRPPVHLERTKQLVAHHIPSASLKWTLSMKGRINVSMTRQFHVDPSHLLKVTLLDSLLQVRKYSDYCIHFIILNNNVVT